MIIFVEMKHFSTQDKKITKSIPRKFLILQKTKTPKKLLVFSQKKAFLIFRETETLKKIPYISVNGSPEETSSIP